MNVRVRLKFIPNRPLVEFVGQLDCYLVGGAVDMFQLHTLRSALSPKKEVWGV